MQITTAQTLTKALKPFARQMVSSTKPVNASFKTAKENFKEEFKKRTDDFKEQFKKRTDDFKNKKEDFKKRTDDFKNKKEDFKKRTDDFKSKFSEDEKESIKEGAYFGLGMVTLAVARHHYLKNPDLFTFKYLENKVDEALEITIPSKFLKKSVTEARQEINHELEKTVDWQSNISSARGVTATLSPAFTAVPKLASPAFLAATVLSASDIAVISRILRVKKMLDIRPDIIPEDKKDEYVKKMNNIQKHIPKEIAFDLLKIFYRGQLVTVNKKLKENEKPQQEYKNSVLKAFADHRLIPSKNNLPIVTWILPTSYIISDLAAKDTQEFKADLQDLNKFFHDMFPPEKAQNDNQSQS